MTKSQNTPSPAVAWKILTEQEMDTLEHHGTFKGAPVDLADGFIHLSTEDQLAGTIEKHFAGQENLHLVAVDLSVLGQAVKWEVSRGGALFPHIYANLPLSAVIAYGPLRHDEAGEIILPPSG